METSVMPVDPTIAVGMLKPDASPKENMKKRPDMERGGYNL